MEALLERIQQLEKLLATTQQQLESTRQNADKEKLATLTRLVEVTAERDSLKTALLEKDATPSAAAAALDVVPPAVIHHPPSASTATATTVASTNASKVAPSRVYAQPKSSSRADAVFETLKLEAATPHLLRAS